jgi:hypothetical protein
MKKTSLLFLVVASLLVLTLPACKKKDHPMSTMTLYDSLGGATMVHDPASMDPKVMIEQGRLGIRSVIDSTIFVIAADTKINHYFNVLLAEVTAGNFSGFQQLSMNLTDFFSVATGAKDYTYTGLSMIVAHNPGTDTTIENPRISEKVNSMDFDEFINDVGAGATKVGLPTYLIARLAAVAETQKALVVQR